MASFKQIREAAKYNPYAIGMAAAKKKAGIGSAHATNLPKSVIVKGHEIAKKIKANEEFDEVLDQLDEITSPMQKLRDALDRHSEKALAANKCGDDEACKVHQNYMNKIKDKMAKLAKNESVELEDEVEILDELDKSTLASYAKKSHDQLLKHTGTVNMKYGRGDKDATAYALDKEALRKTANRTKGLHQAVDKLAKEEVEKIDELDKSTLASYAKKATDDAALRARYDNRDQPSPSKKTIKRLLGAKKAIDKLAKA